MTTSIARILKVVLPLLGGLLAINFLLDSRTIVIDVQPDREFQMITGWEVTLRLWEANKAEDRFDSSWEPHGAEIFDRLVNELGINRVRLEIKSGVENPVDYWRLFEAGEIGYQEYKKHYYEKINDNDDPQSLNLSGFQFSMLDYQVEKMLLPIMRLVEANGEKLFINLCYVDFNGTGPQGPLSHALAQEEYAELVLATFNRLSTKYGITPDALEIILEPDNSVDWRGEQIGNGLVAVAERLEWSGYTPEYIAPSTSYASKAPGYFDDMMEVPGVQEYLTTLAYHRYDPVPDFITLPRINSRAEKYGLRTAMLEHLESGAAQLHSDLTEANSSAWQQYGIAVRLSEGILLRHGYFFGLQEEQNGDENIVLSESARELLHYFKYVRIGAVRIGLRNNHAGYRAAAFRNPNGSHVVVVHGRRQATLTIRNLPAGTYGIRMTSPNSGYIPRVDKEIGIAGELNLVVPESSILTVFQKSPPF